MQHHTIKIAIMILLQTLLFFSCKHEPDALPGNPSDPNNPNNPGTGEVIIECDPDSVYFRTQIMPILGSCAMSGCHDNETQADGINLTSYAKLMESDIIEPGNAFDSDLYEAITEDDPEDRMPKDMAALPADQIAAIRDWINQGAKNNYCNDCDTSNISFAAISSIIDLNCQKCHNSSIANGGVRLDSYDAIVAVANDGRLVNVIEYNGDKRMPPVGKMPDCKITQIKKWVAAGTPQ